MPDIDPARMRALAFKAAMVVRLGPGLGSAARWKARTQLPTLAAMGFVERYAAGRGLDIGDWLFVDSGETALEASHSNWRPAIRQLAGDPSRIP